MKAIVLFFRRNMTSFLGMILGAIAGYFYWQYYGIFDGTFGFSSEWWANSIYGLLLGGLAGSFVPSRRGRNADESVVTENDI